MMMFQRNLGSQGVEVNSLTLGAFPPFPHMSQSCGRVMAALILPCSWKCPVHGHE